MAEKGEERIKNEGWSSAKGYSFRNGYFIFAFIMFVVSIILIFSPFYINDPINSIWGVMYGLGLLIGMLVIFYLAIRDIKRQNDWIYREYSTNLDMNKEKKKKIVLDIIKNICKSNDVKLNETTYIGRFPSELIKSYMIDDKVHLDLCKRSIQKPTLNPFKNRYKHSIIIFIGPMEKENISLITIIKKGLDKIFVQ